MTKSLFPEKLLQWNASLNTRSMPWKGEKDPYRIWLSEIILQQTRVEQGLDYYNKFILTYPTIRDLALAPDEQVFKLWEGLGYYSRCLNLLHTARHIHFNLDGNFPNTYEGLLKLKGIGEYTASAIGSFAFNLPLAVVDGNVHRVISRYFGISTPIDSPEGKKLYRMMADALLDRSVPAAYNQAIMDFGAVICKPKLPLCASCPMAGECEAFLHNMVAQLPVKEKKLVRKSRWLNYFFIEHDNKVLIRKRTSKDIWKNLHELVLVESEQELLEPGFVLEEMIGKNFRLMHQPVHYTQQLTHQVIHGKFFHVETLSPVSLSGYTPVPLSEVEHVAFPRIINQYLQKEAG